MCLVMHCAQARDRHMRVELCGGKRRMAEEFLHDAQICTTFEEMRGRAVPEAVRSDIGCAIDGGHGLMHDRAGLALVDTSTPDTKQ